MRDFTPFPSIPHLVAPRNTSIRNDKVLSSCERTIFFDHPLRIEEKIDGQNLGISSIDGETLSYQGRGSFVELGGRHFRGLEGWIKPRATRILSACGDRLVLFGEWCRIKHTVFYDSLPDWFILFAVYDKLEGEFWAPQLAEALADDLSLSSPPVLGIGEFSLDELFGMIGKSRFGSSKMEGIVAKSINPGSGQLCAKLVRPDFVQSIEGHWMSGPLETNRLAT
ncbi:RNA ligase family protein [Kocuria rhizophila]|uniref:RNA ligase family protein n=1 Tax=Kocuria rhizophila TaxID=72000 RepID=UPI00174DC44C|nr:RNA ligase family protein [Kocuria rhizophila]MCT1545379.1 RNA ligase family protein [Kocuria rhizophila]MCT2170923.1 RNA ligase family protein [Kocuria rhizophila]